MISKIGADTEFVEIKGMIRYLVQHKMISSREGALVIQAASCAYNGMEPKDRVNMLKTLFVTLAEFSR